MSKFIAVLYSLVNAFSWPKVIYSILILSLVLILVSELYRLWFDRNLYIRSFTYVTDEEVNDNAGETFSLRVIDRHTELRHRFNTAGTTEFDKEGDLSPRAGTPIKTSETVLSELSITVQQINITDILGKLRRWVGTPREVSGTLSSTEGAYRVNAVISGDVDRLANNQEIGPSIHIAGLNTEDEAAFGIACHLIWRQAAMQQTSMANLSPLEFCHWTWQWTEFLNLFDKSHQGRGLSKDDLESLESIRENLTSAINRGAKYERYLDLRADVNELLLRHEFRAEQRRELLAQIQNDRFLYRVRLRVDPRANFDKAQLDANPNAQRLLVGMRPALRVNSGLVSLDQLEKIDTLLQTTEFAKLWGEILKPGIETIKAAALATGYIRYKSQKNDQEFLSSGFAIAENIIISAAQNLAFRNMGIDINKAPSVFDLPEDWNGSFSFTDTLSSNNRPVAHRISKVILTGGSLTDIAILEIEGHNTDQYPPLQIKLKASDDIIDGNFVIVVGFPMTDSRLPSAFMEALLGNSPGVKRVMPGRIRKLYGNTPDDNLQSLFADRIAFEASTSGGTAGGPVIDLHSGQLIGLNIGGEYDISDYSKFGWATPISELFKDENLREVFDATSNKTITFSRLSQSLKADTFNMQVQNSVTTDNPDEIMRKLDIEQALGYNPSFLSTTINLPKIDGINTELLDYGHFSLVLNTERRLPQFAAVNIDGSRWLNISRRRQEWKNDPRTNSDYQTDNSLFIRGPLDRGHLVSSQYVTWGSRELASIAHSSAFFYTNATPQNKTFNRGSWRELESFVRDYIISQGLKASIFTGPVLREDDPTYRGYQLPRSFWKILVTTDNKNEIRVAAFLLKQEILMEETVDDNLSVKTTPFDPINNLTSVPTIEKITGLDFGQLKNAREIF